MPEEEWPSEFPPVPYPTEENPVVNAMPPELRRYLDLLRELGWWFGDDVYLVRCGHTFTERVIAPEIELESRTANLHLSSFINEAWQRARKEIDAAVERLKSKYHCVRRESSGVECTLHIKQGATSVEFFSGEWKPYDKVTPGKRIRLAPIPYEAYYVRARAVCDVTVACQRRVG